MLILAVLMGVGGAVQAASETADRVVHGLLKLGQGALEKELERREAKSAAKAEAAAQATAPKERTWGDRGADMVGTFLGTAVDELGKRSSSEVLAFSLKDSMDVLIDEYKEQYKKEGREYAKELGAATVAVTCCPGSVLDTYADIGIAPAPGAEVVTGSTRMKSGTAQKMVLNMLSTGTMIKLGKVYGNLMVDVKASNEKLIRRCVTIVCTATECDEATAIAALETCDYRPKTAIVMILCQVDAQEAKALLEKSGGRVAKVLNP
jgi:hypothetical protein